MADFRVWPATNGPNTDANDDNAPVNLGLIFQVSQTCWAKAIHFYRGNTDISGPVSGRIFQVTGETVVSGTAVDFTLSGTGWQTATLPTPVELAANTSYKVSIHSDDNYTATGGYWSVGAGVGGITNGPLVAPDAGGAPLGLGGIQQGSFRYTSDPTLYPNSYFNGGNYWTDITVTDEEPGEEHTGSGTAPLTLAASGAGAKSTTASASAPLGLAASGAGTHQGVQTATAPITFAASGSGSKQSTGAMPAALALAAVPAGTRSGVGTATAALTLATTRTGIHQGVGARTAPLTLAAFGLTSAGPWPPTAGPPVERRWATSGPPTGHRWASTGPPSETAG